MHTHTKHKIYEYSSPKNLFVVHLSGVQQFSGALRCKMFFDVVTSYR